VYCTIANKLYIKVSIVSFYVSEIKSAFFLNVPVNLNIEKAAWGKENYKPDFIVHHI
jgi:hypothetical protein